MRLVELTRGYRAIVDDEDFERVSDFNWSAVQGHRKIYAVARIGTKIEKMHRFILGVRRGVLVDHVDHNGLNNRRSNLRPASSSQNAQHSRTQTRKSKTSEFKGVHWSKARSCWIAQITFEGNQMVLGEFSRDRDAAICYDGAAIRLFGQFAQTNEMERGALLPDLL